jgi:hypothetical protein
MAIEQQVFSRRAFCKGCASTLGAAVLIALGPKLASAQAKMTQQQVSYQDTPRGPRQCDNCKLFEKPNACKSVEGVISPHGWCVIYKPLS